MDADTKLNWKGILFYGLIITAIAILVLYLLKERTPIYAAINGMAGWVAARLSGVLGNTDIAGLIQKNWGTILGFGVTLIPTVYMLIKTKLSEINKQNQLKAIQESLETEKKTSISAVTAAKEASAEKIQSLEAKLAQYESDSPLIEAQNLLQTKNAEIQKLQIQVQDLTAMKQGLTTEQVKKMITDSQRVP